MKREKNPLLTSFQLLHKTNPATIAIPGLSSTPAVVNSFRPHGPCSRTKSATCLAYVFCCVFILLFKLSSIKKHFSGVSDLLVLLGLLLNESESLIVM